jgi:hypothetical protein
MNGKGLLRKTANIRPGKIVRKEDDRLLLFSLPP